MIDIMSMLSHQIEQLKDLRFRMGTSDRHNSTDWTLIDGAIETIEALSAKLSAANMERSERYYGGGWIACKNRLPFTKNNLLVCQKDGYVSVGYYSFSEGKFLDLNSVPFDDVIAWQLLPQPYKPDKE